MWRNQAVGQALKDLRSRTLLRRKLLVNVIRVRVNRRYLAVFF